MVEGDYFVISLVKSRPPIIAFCQQCLLISNANRRNVLILHCVVAVDQGKYSVIILIVYKAPSEINTLGTTSVVDRLIGPGIKSYNDGNRFVLKQFFYWFV